ncbi:MAG TPA: hypothetical protein VJA17_05470 [Candidatus Omnitrophota bacterium]|nr:hypothetical protein [Candidatus Omnitrophota bacterium]
MRDHFLNLLKLISALVLIPLTAVLTIGFTKSLSELTHSHGHFFWLGVLIYVIVHVFVYEPRGVYQFGQKLSSSILGFYPPLGDMGARALPIYTILSLMAFCFVHLFFKKSGYEIYFIFLTGFTLALHLVLTAQELREENKSPLRPNYFLFIQLIYIFVVLLTSILFTFIVPQYSFATFFYSVLGSIKDIYATIFHQLFIP